MENGTKIDANIPNGQTILFNTSHEGTGDNPSIFKIEHDISPEKKVYKKNPTCIEIGTGPRSTGEHISLLNGETRLDMNSAYAGQGGNGIFVYPGIYFLPNYNSECSSSLATSYISSDGFSWNPSNVSYWHAWEAFDDNETINSSFTTSGLFTSSKSIDLFASSGINLVCTQDKQKLDTISRDSNSYVNIVSRSGLFIRETRDFSEDGKGVKITPKDIKISSEYCKSTIGVDAWEGSMWGPDGNKSFRFFPHELKFTVYGLHDYLGESNEFSLPDLKSWGNKETIALVSDIEKLKESIPSKKYLHRISSKYTSSNSGLVGFDLVSTESKDLSSSTSKLLTIFEENSSNEIIPCYGYVSGWGQLNYIKIENSTLKVYYLNSSTGELATVDLNMESLTDKIIEI